MSPVAPADTATNTGPAASSELPLRQWVPLQRGVEPFETVWPAVHQSVGQRLARRGCQAADREDILQEVAAVLLKNQVAYSCAADLTPYAYRIALRLFGKLRRSRERLLPLDAEVDELPSPVELSLVVENKLIVAALLTALAALPVESRLLLSTANEPCADRREANRRAVQRHRLRARLLAALTVLVIAAALAGSSAAARLNRAAPSGISSVARTLTGIAGVGGARTTLSRHLHRAFGA